MICFCTGEETFTVNDLSVITKTIWRTFCRFVPIPILLLTFVLTAFSEVPAPPEPPEVTEFKFEVQYNQGKITEDIIADIYGDTLIVGIIPFQVADRNLVATFSADPVESITVNGVEQVNSVTSNNFSSPVTYVFASGTDSKTYKVKLVYTGLPLVYIYTQNSAPILNKEDYVDATIKIYPNQAVQPILNTATEIRGRGNTTWTLPKKPYRLKLGAAASVLGMPSDKDWVLLANHSDKTLMRNSLAYDLGHEMNLAYTPRLTHVDLILNGVYQGNYLIGEHIKADKDRVNIKELEPDDTDPSVINGGYFLELDDYRDGLFFELGSGLPFVVKSPDEDDITEAQLEYIRNYMQETEDVLFSANFADPVNGYAKYINPGTFIEWYWVNEVLKNIDAKDGSSIFYYKDRDQKLNMGPLWDLDVAAGNASVNTGDDPTSFYVRESKWFKRLFEDPAFKSAAEARWFTFRDELLTNLPSMIDAYVAKLNLSQQNNFYKWRILNTPIWPSPVVVGSYAGEVAYLREWMSDRIAWIDSQIQQPLMSPVLHSPTEAEVVTSLSPTIKWYPSDDAEKYDVQVSLSQNFETLVVNKTGVTDTTHLVTEQLAEQTTYYWRARAVRADEQSDWSDVWSFRTSVVTGVGEIAYKVSMFPNPTSRELYIEIPTSTPIENAELVDALGRVAISSVLQPGETNKIDVSNLQRGMYVVILRGKLDRPVTSKVVLR